MADDTAIEAGQTVAELRRELALRTAERDEALSQLSATAEVLQVINSSPGDLQPVFDAILEKAHTLCGADHGAMFEYAGDQFRPVATHDIPEALAEVIRRGFRLHPENPLTALVHGEPVVHIADLAELAARLSRDNAMPRLAVELGGMRTLLAVPLRKDEVLLGFIGSYRKEVRPFTDRQIALLQNFAAQAVIAMENARLITETREALEQQTATAEVLGVINSSPGDLAPVFDAILEKAHSLCAVEYGTLQLYDGEKFRAVATRGFPAAIEDLLRQPYSLEPDNPLNSLVGGGRLVQIADLAEQRPGSANPRSEAAVAVGIRTIVFLPLRNEKRLLGLISAGRNEVKPFSEQEIGLLENFAGQAVIAMENARLISETREALEQQTATAEVLQVINSSPGDLAPVFDAMLEKAVNLCAASFGLLMKYDGEALHTVAHHNSPCALVELLHDPVRPSPGMAVDRILRGEDVVAFVDVASDPDYAAASDVARRLLETSHARSHLTVALRKDGNLLGVIVVFRQEVRPFSDEQIALLQNFAAQAVIAMENARLLTETREALEQQTATAEVLQVINASPGRLAPVFDAMLDKATKLCTASFGVLWTIEGPHIRAAASRGVPAAYKDFLEREPSSPGPQSAVAQTVRRRIPLHFNDAAQGDAYRNGDRFAIAAVELGGVRTLLNAPLLKDVDVLGILAVYRQEVRPFTDKQIALLENFAAQAVIAMENARLLTETREALEQQTATAEVLQVINASPGDLGPVFDAMLEKATKLCEAAFGILWRFDGEFVSPSALHRVPQAFAEFWREPRRPGADTGPARMMRGEGTLAISDLAEYSSYRDGDPMARAIVDLAGARSVVIAPLRKDGVTLGAITVYRQEVRPFSDKQIALLQNFAAQAVIAMENARLLGELRQRTEEVAEINRDLEARVAAQLAELERTGKLRRFLAPQLAELIIAQGDESILETHRREIVVAFCDLRGFTAFAERAEPEEVIDLLREYHGALGPIIARFEGTLDHYSGDGIMVFFNDPVPCPEPARRAVEMAAAMREAAQELLRRWRRHGHEIGFGVGIAQGYATLGQIGFAERMDYTAIGTVCNLAARLCAEARDGQILVSSRVAGAVEDGAGLEQVADVSLRGLSQPVLVYNVV